MLEVIQQKPPLAKLRFRVDQKDERRLCVGRYDADRLRPDRQQKGAIDGQLVVSNGSQTTSLSSTR